MWQGKVVIGRLAVVAERPSWWALLIAPARHQVSPIQKGVQLLGISMKAEHDGIHALSVLPPVVWGEALLWASQLFPATAYLVHSDGNEISLNIPTVGKAFQGQFKGDASLAAESFPRHMINNLESSKT
ncbi:hypothetical protein E2C01_055097 [Portunus trituberculatus]|uniref:Uncharacterized protein n=1 Tax=Portunus trituberculatus TaxID=210409 RepID=A0A5B7GWP8_PORTR|nr:hypothetical protein [Portunus trituberculatus]